MGHIAQIQWNGENTFKKLKKSFSPESLVNFNQTWHRASMGEGEWSFINKDHSILKNVIFPSWSTI